MTAGLTARLDTITESLEIASGPTGYGTASYIEWQDAVSHLLDAVPGLVAALRSVLDECEHLELIESRPLGTIEHAQARAEASGAAARIIRAAVAAALESEK